PAPPANHLPEHLLDRGVATRAVGTSAPGCERQVPPHVVHLIKGDAEVGERTEQVRPPATGSVVAVIAAFHPAHAWDGLYVLVRQGQIRVEVTPVEGVRQSVLELHVLLRHRSRSISPGVAPAYATRALAFG